MRKSLYAGLAGLSCVLAAPALAQDMSTDPAAQTTDPAAQTIDPATQSTTTTSTYDAPTTTTAPDPVTSDEPFSTAYVGGSFGYAVQPNDVGSSVLFDRGRDGSFGDVVTTAAGGNAFSPGFCNGAALAATPAGTCRNDRDGIEYYGRVGADQQVGRGVFGFVVDFGKPRIRDSVSAFSTTPGNYVLTRNVDWELTARGRLGFVAGRSTLFYGTFGGGYAKIDRDFRSTNTANAFAQSGKRKQFGFVGGGGVEQLIGNNFSIGLEYLYHQYNDDDFRVAVTQGTAPATNPFVLAPQTAGTDFRRSDDKFRWHSFRATAGFRF